ncbi:hypothetical protein [Palleronia marisminoris]|nr:hypothetical protein [Palleronia marisminoris]
MSASSAAATEAMVGVDTAISTVQPAFAVGDAGDGIERRLGALSVIRFQICEGTVGSDYPEANVLMPLSLHDTMSRRRDPRLTRGGSSATRRAERPLRALVPGLRRRY